ncbi:MAG: SUMF1/EgtB/PvdO family nonheme iron enzyme, partial [Ferruginibacter sp.]|nr:SUMF1/EgtB/PvdO family nonheme iron enzyme [Cytophagales bacterium]
MARKAFIMASNGPESIGRLQYAEKDAEDFAKCLTGPRYGFEVIRPEKGVDQDDIMRILRKSALACEPADDFLCYFSGHGNLEKGELKLVVDDKDERVEMASLDVDAVLKLIRNCRASNKLFILDCCHAGGAIGTKSGSGQLVENVAPQLQTENDLVLMASERLSTIREYADLRGSFLTQKICEALGKEFHQLDKDKDQRISIQDLMDYLKECVVEYNKSKKTPREKAPQPHLFGRLKGAHFILTQESYRWLPRELSGPDESKLIILPIQPKKGLVLCIGKHPISNFQYRRFARETQRSEPIGRSRKDGNWQAGFRPWQNSLFAADDQPVVCISYYDAVDYCKWINPQLSTFLGTPTQTFVPYPGFWNFAAYGTDSVTERYGNSQAWLQQSPQVHHQASAPAVMDQTVSRSNQRGISDMFGNVWEWCSGDGETGLSIPKIYQNNPIVRGGGFLDDLSAASVPYLDSYLLVVEQFKNWEEIEKNLKHKCRDFRSFDLGFRIAA